MTGSSLCFSFASSLVVLLTCAASAAAAPQSAFSSPPDPNRNWSLLPAQICAVVGAYVFTVSVLLTALLTVGRRLRRAALQLESTPRPVDVEMIKPRAFEPSPVSPSAATTRSWRDPLSPSKIRNPLRKSKSGSVDISPTSPTVNSVASFDLSVVERDRLSRQRDMERLYAAVMEHDAKQAQVVYSHDEQPGAEEGRVVQAVTPRERTLDSPKSGRRPPPILTALPAKRIGQTPVSPMSPASMTAPMKPVYPTNMYAATSRDARMPASARAAAFPPTPTSPHSTSSVTSKARKGLRNLRLSAIRPKSSRDGQDADDIRTPLSSTFNMANSPGDPGSVPTTPGTAITAEYHLEQLDRPQPLPLPHPAPQRGLPHPSDFNLTTTTPTLHLPPRSANTSTSTLPLRSLHDGLRSPATKTTFIERRQDPRRLLSPRTGGVPATPYSAYMPFTPITPVTPHLVTRQERKAQQKSALKKAATQDDAVPDSKDLWDSGY